MQAIAEAGQRVVSTQCDQLLSLTRQHVAPVVRPGHPAATTSTLMRQVTHGDVVIVTRLDRLARSTRDLLNILEGFTREGVGFRSLRETSIDTTTPQGRRRHQMAEHLGGTRHRPQVPPQLSLRFEFNSLGRAALVVAHVLSGLIAGTPLGPRLPLGVSLAATPRIDLDDRHMPKRPLFSRISGAS